MDSDDDGRRAHSDAAARSDVAPPPDWFVHTLDLASDLVLVIDGSTRIVWANAAVESILGYRRPEILGRSFAEFIHADDLVRAAEVMVLVEGGAFDTVPITPALYRVATAAGPWISMEVNATPSPAGDGLMLVIARVGGDLVLTDRLLEAATAGESFHHQVDLVLALGLWRHPDEGYAIFYRDEHGARRSRPSYGLPPELYGTTPIPGPTPWEAAMASRADVVIEDLEGLAPDDPRIGPELVAAARTAGYAGCLAAPVGDPGHPEGSCIVIWTAADGPTGSGHRYAMSNMRRALALVLQQRAQVLALERAARIDHLTGVIARARFFDLLDRLEEDAAEGAAHAILYIDLDGFKGVNDSFGHAAGDRVLTVAAQRMATVTPDQSLLARLGGDEFVVVCPTGTDDEAAVALAQAVIDVFASPIDVDGMAARVGASVGVAVGHPGQSAQAVLDAADRALLAAKSDGRSRWRRAPA